MKIRNKGFTLIELLVVIAIISLLSSVVLASLNSARAKARTTAIKMELSQLAVLANLSYNEYSTYSHLQAGVWVNGGTVLDCSAMFSGIYGERAREICAKIVKDTILHPNTFHSGVFSGPYSTNNNFAFMAILPSGEYACAGSSGGRYVGPSDPGGGSWTGKGCWANP